MSFRNIILVLVAGYCLSTSASAEQLIPLRSGLNLRGVQLDIATLNEASSDKGIQSRPIWMIDDGLRRTYVHRRGMVSAEPVGIPDLSLKIEFPQPVAEGADEVGALGQILGATPFDRYGRRELRVRGPQGSPMVIYQGISELTARYAKVDGLKSDDSVGLDMRISTKTISTETLKNMFQTLLDWDNPNQRLEFVRLLIETERYGDARRELLGILNRFPGEEQLRPQLAALVERQATQLLDEAKLRAESGQTRLARAIYRNFPLNRVSRLTRKRVEDEVAALDQVDQQIQTVREQLGKLVKQLPEEEQPGLAGIVREIRAKLSPNTLPRMSDFVRLGGNEEMPVDQRVALGIAGWILGSGSGQQNLKLATSLIEVRDLVIEILAEQDPAQRDAMIAKLETLEATRAEDLARLLPLIRPPLSGSEDQLPADTVADEQIAGLMRVGPDEATWFVQQANDPLSPTPASYLVQLPPEYDPLKAYPCVVALHAAGAPPESQLNWWSGIPAKQFLAPETDTPPDQNVEPVEPKSTRLGHAARHGFIVVAPRWTRGGQRDYEYTAREHDAVLRSLRSAMRRFAIDADRVFIGGHGAGGTAAWDIAVSHPDLWAGMIAISSNPDKTLHHYSGNAVYVPTYFVLGGKDDYPFKKDGLIYDDYMTYQHDSMVVTYRGRGKEFFYEEIDRIFEWMKSASHRRMAIPEKLELVSMRENDSFFWWLEWAEPLENTVIDPILWNEAERIKAAKVSASVLATNEVVVHQAPAKAFTIWLTPQMPLDFGNPISARSGGMRGRYRFNGEIRTMLEDVRVRADRVRPFWAKIDLP